MVVRDASEADVAAITAIYNHAVEHTTAIWNDQLVDEANRRAWLLQRRSDGYPILVADDSGTDSGASGGIVGYATYGPWRPFDGYRHTVEHSVYVRHDQRGRGIGTLLMRALIERARSDGKHVMVAGVDAGNGGSITLHERLGFSRVGLLPQVGTKFGRWLDLMFLQLLLED